MNKKQWKVNFPEFYKLFGRRMAHNQNTFIMIVVSLILTVLGLISLGIIVLAKSEFFLLFGFLFIGIFAILILVITFPTYLIETVWRRHKFIKNELPKLRTEEMHFLEQNCMNAFYDKNVLHIGNYLFIYEKKRISLVRVEEIAWIFLKESEDSLKDNSTVAWWYAGGLIGGLLGELAKKAVDATKIDHLVCIVDQNGERYECFEYHQKKSEKNQMNDQQSFVYQLIRYNHQMFMGYDANLDFVSWNDLPNFQQMLQSRAAKDCQNELYQCFGNYITRVQTLEEQKIAAAARKVKKRKKW